MNNNVKFVADVQHIKEIILVAEADLGYWQTKLNRSSLSPYSTNGKAELLISGTDLRWMGMPSNEVTISLAVSQSPQGNTHDGYYLIHAFNSSTPFAFIERTFFHTPYYPGRIQVDESVPAKLQLSDNTDPLLLAQMGGKREPLRSQDELWQGKIFLPGEQARRYFIARLGGHTHAYKFDEAVDKLEIASHGQPPVFQWLQESQWHVTEWRLRSDASHGKSSTFTDT